MGMNYIKDEKQNLIRVSSDFNDNNFFISIFIIRKTIQTH